MAGDGPLGDWARAQITQRAVLGQLPARNSTPAWPKAAPLSPPAFATGFALVPAEAHALGTPVLASGLGNGGVRCCRADGGLCLPPATPTLWPVPCAPLGQMSFDCNAIAARARRTYSEDENYNADALLYKRNDSMNQFTARLHIPPKRLLRKLSGEKKTTPSPCAPVPMPGAPTAARPGRLHTMLPARPGFGYADRCSTTGTAAAGSTPRPWTWPQVSAASGLRAARRRRGRGVAGRPAGGLPPLLPTVFDWNGET